jgi:hypothetical protein
MPIGWITDIVEADSYYSTHIGFREMWAGFTVELKTAALTTSYNRIVNSNEVAVPVNPSGDALDTLKYAQLEHAGQLGILGPGGEHRAAAIGQGITRAGIVEESYDSSMAGKLPPNIMAILDDFKTEKAAYISPIYRDETDNPAYDRAH